METIIKWNEELMGAPVGVLIVMFALALGYLLKTVPKFNNAWIPLVVVGFCTVGFMLLAPARGDVPVRIYLTRNFIIGFIIGFVAWTFHAQILKRWIDPKIFPEPERYVPPSATETNPFDNNQQPKP